MTALLSSLCVFLIVLGSALVGSWLGKRLPPHHQSSETKDIVKFGTGAVATLAALVLGLLVASAKGSYDAKAVEIEQSAAKVILLDQMLRQLGPEAAPARQALRSALVARYSMTWVVSETSAIGKGSASSVPVTGSANAIRAAVAGIAPASDAQRALQTRALQTIEDFLQTRWQFIAQSTDAVSTPLLVVLVIWLAAIVFCTGLYAPRNALVFAVAVVYAVSVSAAIFLIAEMYSPFEGIMRISDAPLRLALEYISRP